MISRGSIVKKIVIIVGVILAGAVGYIIYVAVTFSPTPKITNVEFPEKINLNEFVNGTFAFEDSDGDITQLLADELDKPSSDIIDLTAVGITGIMAGNFTYGQEVDNAYVVFQRLTLVDAQGNRSAPYILQYQAGDTADIYERYDAEEANQRPVSQRRKIHFFVLSGTESELEQGASFGSDGDMLGAVSPAVAKLFEYTAVPEINGLWDQCGIEFELGDVKVVRAEKVKLPSGRSLSYLLGNYGGKKAALIRSYAEGIKWMDGALPILGVPKGDLAVFIVGYGIWNLEDNSQKFGFAANNTGDSGDTLILSWRNIHFEDENAGYIVVPRLTLSALAHEIGHDLGLFHPGEDEVIPKNKFSKFNLMDGEKGLRSELIPEQCEIAKANVEGR